RVGSALITGNGNVSVGTNGVTLSNDANTYTGTTTFRGCNGVCSSFFTSIADLGQASSLGAPTTVENGTIVFNQSSQYSDNLIYIGGGHSSNRNWSIAGAAASIRNRGTGTLTLTGDLTGSGGTILLAEDADIALLGVIAGSNCGFNGNAGRTVTLGGANTYTGATSIGNVTVAAPVLADIGAESSFGAGDAIALGHLGTLSYTGPGATSDRTWTSQGTTAIVNDGTGALTLSGPLSFVAGGQADHLTLGGSYGGASTFAGEISGAGNLIGNGSGTWVLGGANTYTGALTVESGTLQAGSAQAFGTATAVTVNGGTLDLDDLAFEFPTLAGSGGIVDLGTADLTLNAGTGVSSSYAGGIVGSGGLIKRGASTQTLSGANAYTGATTVGGGTLRLDFAAATAPASNILSDQSSLVLAGGSLVAAGGAGENNTQAFDGVNVTAGNNNIGAVSGAGGSMTLDLGAIVRSGGLVDFDLPSSGNITTSNTQLGGWATVNDGSSYAKVVGGNITAFTDDDYEEKDEAANWLDDEFITDDDGDADSFSGTVSGSKQLGGLRYGTAAASTVTIGAGEALGVDGTVRVAPSVGHH